MTMKDVIIERLERLERECHRLRRQALPWKLAGSLALVGVVVLIIGGSSQKKIPKTIEADQYVLRDEAGKRRAVLEVCTQGHTVLSLSDKNEKPRVTLVVAADGSPVMSLDDENGHSRVSFASSKVFGGSVINLADREGKLRLGMAVRDDGGVPTLDLRDKEANRRIILGVKPDGSGTLELHGENESARVRLALGRDLPSLLLFDKDENPRLGMVVSPTGSVGVDIFGKEKRLSIGLEPEGKMNLRIIDNKDGKVIFEVPEP
jgi:hypothetical protein